MPPKGKLLHGTSLIRVGERKAGDKKYAVDEYLLAPPGTIVAPRLRNEEPTPENAARAIIAQGKKLGMLPEGAAPEDILGGSDMNMPAYTAYRAAQGTANASAPARLSRSARDRSEPQRQSVVSRASRNGPPMYHMLQGAEEGMAAAPGMAVNPFEEALRAISQVATQRGIDPTAAAGMLNTPASQGPQPTIPMAEGTTAFQGLLEQLLSAAGLTGPDLMLAQLGIMNSIGSIDPRALGITDPAKFRSLLGENMGMPTLDARKQTFNESLFGFSQSAPMRGNVPTVASS